MTSMTGFDWVPAHERSDTPLADPTDITEACAQMQWTEAQCADPTWFAPTLNELHDPMLMAGMAEAVSRLQGALDRDERIRIITDYDVDGTTSSLILQATLRILHPDVKLDYHIPDRFKEGYGFSVLAAQRAVDDGIKLIVTADIGVRDQAAVDVARAGGVDVLICDHHLPPGEDVPAGALVLCPPQKACTYPNPHLAACGVSLKLAQAMLAESPKFEPVIQSMLKLAAIGTVADMVPLTSAENRAIVILGLRSLNTSRHGPGLTALLKVAQAKKGEIDEGTIGYQIGPRINAAGRMADAKIIIEMLNCRQADPARALADRVESMNQERRAVQDRLVTAAMAQLESPTPAFVMVSGPEEEGWHRGVVGIVASRLMRTTHRPAAVISIQSDKAVGSMRSIDGVHCVDLLDSVADLLLKYGGHPKAAGFSLAIEHLPEFQQRMTAAVEQSASEDSLRPTRTYSLQVLPTGLVMALPTALKRLAPFGMGNPTPSFLIRQVEPKGVRTMSGGKHLKFQMDAGGRPIDVVWWNEGGRAEAFSAGPVDLLGTVSVNTWQGRSSVQFMLEDARV